MHTLILITLISCMVGGEKQEMHYHLVVVAPVLTKKTLGSATDRGMENHLFHVCLQTV